MSFFKKNICNIFKIYYLFPNCFVLFGYKRGGGLGSSLMSLIGFSEATEIYIPVKSGPTCSGREQRTGAVSFFGDSMVRFCMKSMG